MSRDPEIGGAGARVTRWTLPALWLVCADDPDPLCPDRRPWPTVGPGPRRGRSCPPDRQRGGPDAGLAAWIGDAGRPRRAGTGAGPSGNAAGLAVLHGRRLVHPHRPARPAGGSRGAWPDPAARLWHAESHGRSGDPGRADRRVGAGVEDPRDGSGAGGARVWPQPRARRSSPADRRRGQGGAGLSRGPAGVHRGRAFVAVCCIGCRRPGDLPAAVCGPLGACADRYSGGPDRRGFPRAVPRPLGRAARGSGDHRGGVEGGGGGVVSRVGLACDGDSTGSVQIWTKVKCVPFQMVAIFR